MLEEQELWHECIKCGSIFDADISACPPCRMENPQEVHLTLREVLQRVESRMVWTKQPVRFYELLDERKRDRAQGELEVEAALV